MDADTTTIIADHDDDRPLLGPSVTLTVGRRDQTVLIGINRPAIYDRLDPVTRARLGEASYQYEHDATLRAAVLIRSRSSSSRTKRAAP